MRRDFLIEKKAQSIKPLKPLLMIKIAKSLRHEALLNPFWKAGKNPTPISKAINAFQTIKPASGL